MGSKQWLLSHSRNVWIMFSLFSKSSSIISSFVRIKPGRSHKRTCLHRKQQQIVSFWCWTGTNIQKMWKSAYHDARTSAVWFPVELRIHVNACRIAVSAVWSTAWSMKILWSPLLIFWKQSTRLSSGYTAVSQNSSVSLGEGGSYGIINCVIKRLIYILNRLLSNNEEGCRRRATFCPRIR